MYCMVQLERVFSGENVVYVGEMKMQRVCALGVIAVCILAGPVSAELIPVGDYALTFERTGWSETRTISVQPFPAAESFYTVGGQDVNVYLQPLGDLHGPQFSEFTWYVNAPAVLGNPGSLDLLGGTGPLSITIRNMTFLNTASPAIVFQPLITHIYYVGYNGAEYVPMDVPGSIPVSPGSSQLQRSPVRPLAPADVDYAAYGPAYGTPYQTPAGVGTSFVLPEMYVPDGEAIWELSFGAAFTQVPEPSVIVLLMGGALTFGVRKRT